MPSRLRDTRRALRVAVFIEAEEFACLFSPEAAAALGRLGDVVHSGGGDAARVPAGTSGSFDAIVTSWSTEVFDPAVLVGPRLVLAVHAGGSLRALYPHSVLGRRLQISQAGADAMSVAVAEMSLTLSLALLRNLHLHDRGLQNRRGWYASGHGKLGRAIQGRRIGVVGLGRTGRHYVRMVQGMGVTDIRVFDPFATPSLARDLGVDLTSLDRLFATCDLVAIHAPSTPETHHMVGAAQLSLLPEGAVLVNTARSALIDQAALLAEVRSGRIKVGLDVFDEEPLPSDSPLLGLDNVLLTPHVAGGTFEARRAQGWAVVAELERFARGEPLAHEVTAEMYESLA